MTEKPRLAIITSEISNLLFRGSFEVFILFRSYSEL